MTTQLLTIVQRYAGLIEAHAQLQGLPEGHVAKRALFAAMTATRREMTDAELAVLDTHSIDDIFATVTAVAA